MDEIFDVLVVGAGEEANLNDEVQHELNLCTGPSGLNAAKTYLDCEPDIDLWILDSVSMAGR